jgi:hypothetical protein
MKTFLTLSVLALSLAAGCKKEETAMESAPAAEMSAPATEATAPATSETPAQNMPAETQKR